MKRDFIPVRELVKVRFSEACSKKKICKCLLEISLVGKASLAHLHKVFSGTDYVQLGWLFRMQGILTWRGLIGKGIYPIHHNETHSSHQKYRSHHFTYKQTTTFGSKASKTRTKERETKKSGTKRRYDYSSASDICRVVKESTISPMFGGLCLGKWLPS